MCGCFLEGQSSGANSAGAVALLSLGPDENSSRV